MIRKLDKFANNDFFRMVDENVFFLFQALQHLFRIRGPSESCGPDINKDALFYWLFLYTKICLLVRLFLFLSIAFKHLECVCPLL